MRYLTLIYSGPLCLGGGGCCRPWSKVEGILGAETCLARCREGRLGAPPCNVFPGIQDPVSPLEGMENVYSLKIEGIMGGEGPARGWSV